MSGGEGLASAVALALAEAGPMIGDDAVQLPLLDVGAVEAARDGVEGRDPGRAVEAVRRAGRPKGATNKRTGAWRDYLLSKYAHPLEVLAQAYSRPVETLAAELGCTRKEAFDSQIRAAAELAPFIESKMPVGVAIDARGVIQLVINGAEPAAIGADASEVMGLSAMAQIQGLSE